MILARGPDTIKVTEVKGHATEADVVQGGVRLEKNLGTLRLTLLLTWVDDINLRRLWMLGGPC